jgi:NADH dehydrogenase
MLAQVATQSGGHVGHTIIRRLAGDTVRRPFRYRDLGTMATISRLRAIAVLGTLRVAGFPAWLLWLLVHLITLTGFKNRLSVLFNWTVAFLGRGRAERVITAQQVFARHALEPYARENGTAAPISTTAFGSTPTAGPRSSSIST